MKRSGMAAVAVLGLAVAVGSPMARGGPLDPNAFTSLGTLNITGGSYTFDTSTDQLFDAAGHVLFTGVTYNGIAVFDFSEITMSGVSFSDEFGWTDPGSRAGVAIAGGHQLQWRRYQR